LRISDPSNPLDETDETDEPEKNDINFELDEEPKQESKTSNLRLVLGWFIFVCVLLVVFSMFGQVGKFAGKYLGSFVGQIITQVKYGGILEKSLKQASIKLRKDLPIRIDENTVLNNITTTKNTMIYHYTINMKRESIDLEIFKANMVRHLIKYVCNNKDMEFVFKLGGKYSYEYWDPEGLFIAKMKISSRECE